MTPTVENFYAHHIASAITPMVRHLVRNNHVMVTERCRLDTDTLTIECWGQVRKPTKHHHARCVARIRNYMMPIQDSGGATIVFEDLSGWLNVDGWLFYMHAVDDKLFPCKVR